MAIMRAFVSCTGAGLGQPGPGVPPGRDEVTPRAWAVSMCRLIAAFSLSRSAFCGAGLR